MLTKFNYAYGQPTATGRIKNSPDDFCVSENLGFELSGEGEHLLLLIEKKMLNTEDMVKIIGKYLHLPYKAISYAGLKDKFATTTQWFSVHLPGLADPDLAGLNTPQHRIITAMRHNKKLKIGALKENHFVINIHDFNYDEYELLARIATIKEQGIPNYFGAQRFGYNGRNLDHAKDVLLDNKTINDRHLRGIYYSAARSFIFNKIVSHRINEACWNLPVPGDLMMLAGSHSVFPVGTINDAIMQRVRTHDIFPAACLWGIGDELISEKALDLQHQAIAPWQDWCNALAAHKLQKMYRSMVLIPENLSLEGNQFSFTLPAGSYATAVFRELFTSDGD